MNIRLFKTFALQINGFVLLFSLLVFALLSKLGLWQLERATEKDLRVQQMLLYQQQEAIALNDIPALIAQTMGEDAANEKALNDLLNDLPVSLSGTFINKQSFLLDNQVYNGRLGYRVIKLFQDEKSKSTVLVNLGWIPGSVDRAYIPEVEEITDQIAFRGNIRVIEPWIILADEPLQADVWPQRIQSIDIKKISRLLAQPLLPFVVYVDNEDSLGYIKDWEPIVMPPEKHRGYAFQWFTLALAWVILMLSAAYKSAKKTNEYNQIT